MTGIRFHPVLAALCVAAGCAWGGSAFAQFVPTPVVPGLTNVGGNAIEQRLYPGVPTGGIMTESPSQGESPVRLGSGGSVGVPAASGGLTQPAWKPPPGMLAVPSTDAVRALGGDALRGLPGPTLANPSSGSQGLFTAPSVQDPLGKLTP
jgi:hypothetical protein